MVDQAIYFILFVFLVQFTPQTTLVASFSLSEITGNPICANWLRVTMRMGPAITMICNN